MTFRLINDLRRSLRVDCILAKTKPRRACMTYLILELLKSALKDPCLQHLVKLTTYRLY
eukprot:Awhi_evm1s12484